MGGSNQINVDLMGTYCEYAADRLLVALGNEVHYGAENPFDWMEMISLQGKSNLFESQFLLPLPSLAFVPFFLALVHVQMRLTRVLFASGVERVSEYSKAGFSAAQSVGGSGFSTPSNSMGAREFVMDEDF